MDGFETMKGVLILAATNRPQVLDPALLRPGRFDRHIYIEAPNRAAREAIFKRWSSKNRFAPGIDLAKLAECTDGHSGAEIVGILHAAGEASLKRFVGQPDDALHVWEEDIMAAIEAAPKMITPDMIEGYVQWERKIKG